MPPSSPILYVVDKCLFCLSFTFLFTLFLDNKMASNKIEYDFAIVGAGISGLSLAVTILQENPLSSIVS